jgi:hypothetical protein
VLDSGMSDMVEPIVLTLLHVVNDPATRSHVRPFLDLQVCMTTPRVHVLVA